MLEVFFLQENREDEDKKKKKKISGLVRRETKPQERSPSFSWVGFRERVNKKKAKRKKKKKLC